MFFKHDVWFVVQDFYVLFLLFSTTPAFLGISPTAPRLPPHQFLQHLQNPPAAPVVQQVQTASNTAAEPNVKIDGLL